MSQYGQLRNIAKLFRLVELCLGLVCLCWAFTRLPLAFKTSGVYFGTLIAVILSPLFVFVVSNVIVLTLLIKSGQFCAETLMDANAGDDLCDELVKASENGGVDGPGGSFLVPLFEEEIVYQDKQTILEVRTTTIAGNSSSRSGSNEVKAIVTDNVSEENYRKLLRSETVKCRKVANPGNVPEETVYFVDQLSNEEFQHMIEAFIARQVKFHREEKLAIVLDHGHT